MAKTKKYKDVKTKPKVNKRSKPLGTSDYDMQREKTAQIMQMRREAGRDIEIPEVVNVKRRELCRLDLRLFCLTYFIERFPKPFSESHINLIKDIESAVLLGDMKAFALPRGSGKTTISEVAAIWAAVYGHQKFIVLLAASTEMAQEGLLATIKTSLEHTDLMLEDFPHVCAPIRALEGENKRCIGQTCNGEPTRIQWKKDRIILPKVPGSECSETIIHATGILGTIRGLKYLNSSGQVIRPGLVLIDDPQTDESARSHSQCVKRLNVIISGVMQMAGPGESIAAMMPCTVIVNGDMAHAVLDRELHPDWRGICLKMVISWSDNHEVLWMQDYAQVRKQGLLDEDNGKSAAEFYIKNREKMDAGASVYWEDRFNAKKNEVSAIQHAYNILLKFGEATFQAEYQNDPIDDFSGEEPLLTESDIQAKAVEPVKRRQVPIGYETLTTFIDCGAHVLHYAVCAHGDYCSGTVIDYGTHPVKDAGKAGGVEARVYEALQQLTGLILGRTYRVADGGELKVGFAAIDAGWQTKTVYRFVRNSQYANILHPYMGASQEGFRVPKKNPRSRTGDAWYIQKTVKREAMLLHVNVDYWKSFVEERFRVSPGGRGSLTIFKRQHGEFASHMVAETRTRKQAKSGEEYDKWLPRPGMANHWLDCIVGCHCAYRILPGLS